MKLLYDDTKLTHDVSKKKKPILPAVCSISYDSHMKCLTVCEWQMEL